MESSTSSLAHQIFFASFEASVLHWHPEYLLPGSSAVFARTENLSKCELELALLSSRVARTEDGAVSKVIEVEVNQERMKSGR